MASQDIAQNLRDNNNNWRAVKQAIEDKGVSTTGLTTADYDDAIRSIPTGGGGNLDTLNVTPTTSQQTLTPTSPLDGWDEVVVGAVDASIDSDIVAGNIKSGVNILGVTGNYSGETPILQTKSVNPTTSQQVVEPDNNYDGLSAVTVGAVTAAIDNNIQAGNIKSGVNILGVNGTYSGGSNYQQKTIEPNFSNGDVVVSADSGYDALSQVTIEKDSDLVSSNIKNGVTVHGITGSYTGSGVTLNPHPKNLAYACAKVSGYTDILPEDGSWTTAVDLTALEGSNAIRYMFRNNTVVEDLDLTGWTIPNAKFECSLMFSGCSNLKHIRGSLSFAKCTQFVSMFIGCTSLITCGITNFGFGDSTSSITLDLEDSRVLDADTLIRNMETNNSGKTRILLLNADVFNGLSSDIIALAASKNITLDKSIQN